MYKNFLKIVLKKPYDIIVEFFIVFVKNGCILLHNMEMQHVNQDVRLCEKEEAF